MNGESLSAPAPAVAQSGNRGHILKRCASSDSRSVAMLFPSRVLILLTMLVIALPAVAAEPAPLPYHDDPAVIQAIANLGDRSALALPKFTVDAKSDIYGCQTNGPVTRGYTMRMAYAPDRQTALYHGGDHQTIRSNDVWEFHLGSNTWHMIFEPDGGNHGPMKDVLLFLARRLREKPDQPMTDDERKRFEEVRPWWKANVILKDGHFTTTHGGPILPVHTWDTLVYEPNRRVMIHGTGASPTDSAVLQSHYTGVPLAEVDQLVDKSYSSIWMFDPFSKQWITHKRPARGAMPDMEGMGATMCYIPDLKRVIYYVAAQNVSPHAYGMWSWDVMTNDWTELKPNGGKSVDTLVLRDKVAPTEEQQTAYSPKHKQLVAVIGNSTFAYHVLKNEWSRLNDQVPLECHDAKTMFAYDSVNDVFLLTDGNKQGRVAAFSLTGNKWEMVTPAGDGCPPSDYGAGKYWAQPKGYFDPRLNVLVVHGGMTDRVWVYRHQRH